MSEEGLARQGFGEDVCSIVCSRDVAGFDDVAGDELADEEVASFDVLRLGVQHGIEREVDGGGVVHQEKSRVLLWVARLRE